MTMWLEWFIRNCVKNLEKSEKWYLHNHQTVSEKVNDKLIWGMNIQCHNIIVVRRPDIAIVNKVEVSNNYRCCNTWGQKHN